ncbi:MAG: hypothetical protein ACE5LU_02790 [Anaerolineae bacterium]
MRKRLIPAQAILVLALLAVLAHPALGQSANQLTACKDFAYSTEEDFVTQGPEPADGDPVISDGDLLNRFHTVCMRNADLVQVFDVRSDMGLDAVDVLDVDQQLVAFSTELNSPFGNFTHGDLLTTLGAAIPNQALLLSFELRNMDLGLDAVHFVGDQRNIAGLLDEARQIGRKQYLENPDRLVGQLRQWNVDIWFSTEGTAPPVQQPQFLDGDLLSARDGIIVARNSTLLPASVPAGIPDRGVDFGLDAATAPRNANRREMRFSTSILYRGQPAFTDGDILKFGNGVDISDDDLYSPFEPRADFLGTDALFMRFEEQPLPLWDRFLPLILRQFRQLLGLEP